MTRRLKEESHNSLKYSLEPSAAKVAHIVGLTTQLIWKKATVEQMEFQSTQSGH